jgi:two-component system NtrC family sensor kinase
MASPTILCVDDESAILNALRRVFLDEPWTTLFANGGEEGLRTVTEQEVDVVLADFRMPGMDGVEFLRRVKAIRPECLRVVLSGYADINLVISALNEGQIYKFLSKPWNDDELRHHVRKLLDHQRLNRENRRLNSVLLGLNERLERKIDANARETDLALRFARVALEAVPVAVVGVSGKGEVFLANARARSLMDDERHGDALARAVTAAVAAARAAPGGHHVEPLVLEGEAAGVVVATAGAEPLGLDAPRAATPERTRS